MLLTLVMLMAALGLFAITASAVDDITVTIDTADDSSEQPEESTDDTPVKPGDSSSMIICAIIALVAIAGSAVVIKTRR